MTTADPVRPADDHTPVYHLVSLPHTQTTDAYLTCAYTQKVVKFCRMFPDRVILYAGEANTAPCREHVVTVTAAEQTAWFGPWTPQGVMAVTWDPAHPAWTTMNARVVEALRTRIRPRDLVLLTAGAAQAAIAAALPYHLVCEWAVGYEGVHTPFCAFESSAWMHHVYGLRGWRNGRFYDAIIPNFFDPAEFTLAGTKDDYLLFLGRITHRKGPHVAAQIAEAAGRRLLVAGPGATTVTRRADGGTRIVGDAVVVEGPHVTYIGPVGVAARAELLARAAALLAPTLYVEPFGGVAVEAMLSGTPVIATDWGAFRETVDPQWSGVRFRTLQEGVDAVQSVQALAPAEIRWYAHGRYSLTAVRPQFERWFAQLAGLWGAGWPALRERPPSEVHSPTSDAAAATACRDR